MHALAEDVLTISLSLLPECCVRCVNDAGYQSGMAGAARCPIIEQAMDGAGLPAQWSAARGQTSCAAFSPDPDC